jgi:hypothetical protein
MCLIILFLLPLSKLPHETPIVELPHRRLEPHATGAGEGEAGSAAVSRPAVL